MNKFLKIVGAVALINIVAKLFGFLREVVIGYQYGTSFIADSIITAYTIPNFIYLVVGGALTTAFISVYHSTENRKYQFVRQSFTSISLVITVITVLFLVFADPLLNFFFDDLSNEEYTLARNLFYLMMPSTIFLVISTWMSGVMNVNGKFHLSSFSVLLYNFSFLAIAFGLSFVFGPIAYGVGALIGAVLMVFFLIYGFIKLKTYSLKPLISWNTDEKKLWLLALPIMLGGATLQFYAVIQRIFAAGLDQGAISAVNYASKLTQFPQGVLMTAVTTVIYPMLSKMQGDSDEEGIKRIYKSGMRYLSLLLVPVSIFAFIYSEEIVEVIFEYGNFTMESTAVTAPILKIFTLSMLFLAATTYVTRFYYAKANSYIPVIFSVVNVFGVNILIINLLVDEMGASSIAWGTVISSLLNFILLIIYAKFKYKLTIFEGERSEWSKVLGVSILVAASTFIAHTYLDFENKFLSFAIGFLAFIISYGAGVVLFKVQEAQGILKKLKLRS